MCVANVKTDIALEDNDILFFHQTRLGSTAYTSYSDATVASWYSYDEWGKPHTEYTAARHDLNQAGLDGAGQTYTGYAYDTVLEIYYAQARFYDPDTRQFMTKDPARDGSLWYAYCGYDPVNRVDPTGFVPVMVKYAMAKVGGTATWQRSGSTIVKLKDAEFPYKLSNEMVRFGRLIVDSARLARDLGLIQNDNEKTIGDRFIHYPEQEFENEIDAVLAFAITYNPKSVKSGNEWGANIFELGPNRFVFADVKEGLSNSVERGEVSASGSRKWVAMIHTHGNDPDNSGASEYFSGFYGYDGDGNMVKGTVKLYLVTPQGVLKVLSPTLKRFDSNGKEKLIIKDDDPAVTVLAWGLPT